MKTILISRIKIDRKSCISVQFPYDSELIKSIKLIEGVKWSLRRKAFHFEENAKNITEFERIFKPLAAFEYSDSTTQEKIGASVRLGELNIEDKEVIEKFTRWMEHKRYSESTITSYKNSLRDFLQFIKPKKIEEAGNEELVNFVNDYIIPKRLSFTYQNHVVSSIKLFYEQHLNRKIDPGKLERPRKESKLPNVLSKEEIKKILESIINVKHRLMLSTIYSCGLRRSELLNLKPGDIDSQRNILKIRSGKGRKDRIVPISMKLIEELRDYYRKTKPKTWLFEGWKEGQQYSASSLESVLKKAVKKANIKKQVTLHWLRHSYATHLLEAGVDLRYIQELLGHQSSRTTEIYTHVSTKMIQNIKSPYDDL